MEIISYENAIAKGLKRYFTGKPCKYGHVNQRTVCNRCCVTCNDEKVRKNSISKGVNVGIVARTAIAKKDAIKNGNSTYMSETKCSRGHFERYVASGACVKCGVGLSRKHNIRKYGITLEYYEQLLISQNSSCKICKMGFSESKQNAHIDHCHSTGKVRGLLCMHCNTALGHFKDNIDILQIAIEYLKASKDETCPA